jgi:hypothetical protein
MTDTDDSQRYFRAIEETFIRLRGAPLLLSPEDWRQADAWRRGGVPLELVLATLDQVFTRRRERGAGDRIQSLRYCASAVETAWQEVEALTAGGRRRDAPAVDVAARLSALAGSLPPAQAELARRVRELAGSTSDVERALASLDEQMMAAVLDEVDDAERRVLEGRTAAALSALSGRIEAEELAEARDRLLRQALRRARGLPVLSLFSSEATAGDAPHQ